MISIPSAAQTIFSGTDYAGRGGLRRIGRWIWMKNLANLIVMEQWLDQLICLSLWGR